MSNSLYLVSPGNIPKALRALKDASTPQSVSQDFVRTKLGIPGSSGDQMASFLKRLGFSASDGTPTEIYRDYRGTKGKKGKKAVAQAIKSTYGSLYERNEYLHECDDATLKDIIVQETGLASDARPASLIFSTLKSLFAEADFDDFEDSSAYTAAAPKSKSALPIEEEPPHPSRRPRLSDSLEMRLGYTINLNLPENSDIEVFNAIFKSLKENLLRPDYA